MWFYMGTLNLLALDVDHLYHHRRGPFLITLPYKVITKRPCHCQLVCDLDLTLWRYVPWCLWLCTVLVGFTWVAFSSFLFLSSAIQHFAV